MRDRDIVLPTIHWNGTSAQRLYDQYSAALNAVRTAIDAVIENGPNARDYYVSGNWSQAETEHRNRVMRLRSVADELEAILEHVADNLR